MAAFDFTQLFEESPKLAFQTFRPQGRSPNQESFFSNLFDKVFDSFLGKLGGQILAGDAPDARFQEHLQNFDFAKEAARTPSQFRGMQLSSSLAPRTRFLIQGG
jgi:hypothetical protein